VKTLGLIDSLQNNTKIQLFSSKSCIWTLFIKFQPEKYDFNLYKGFFIEKMANIHQISKNIFLKSPDFYDKFQQVAKNIKRFYLFQTLISNM